MTLVEEAKLLKEGSSLQQITELFTAIARWLDSGDTSSQEGEGRLAVAQLRGSKIFPTRRGLATTGQYSLRTALGSDEWYIPDDRRTAKVFGARLEFLSVDSTRWHELYDLIKIRSHLISRAAKPEAQPEGDDGPSHPYEHTPQEDLLQDTTTPDEHWPTRGELVLKDLDMGHIVVCNIFLLSQRVTVAVFLSLSLATKRKRRPLRRGHASLQITLHVRKNKYESSPGCS